MNQKQKEYAHGRVREIAGVKANEIRDADRIADRPTMPDLSDHAVTMEQAIKQINAGKLRLCAERKHRTHYRDSGLWDYLPENANLTPEGQRLQADHAARLKAHEKLAAARAERIEKKLAALQVEVTRILDELHLGDAQAAIEAIRAFEGKGF